MATRNGKIAQLPNNIREQLNLRLFEGETGRELAAWLNALPAVQSILASQFNGSDISEVNLTSWRQGGYLQWLTEREFFDSSHALANGDCQLADAGLSAERLLNILTLRFGQLLMSWDSAFDENASQTSTFAVTARKARILQGISRSVLAIHRIQSQSASSKAASKGSNLKSPTRSTAPTTPTEVNQDPPSPVKVSERVDAALIDPIRAHEQEPKARAWREPGSRFLPSRCAGIGSLPLISAAPPTRPTAPTADSIPQLLAIQGEQPKLGPDLDAAALPAFRTTLGATLSHPKILVGPILPSGLPLKRSRPPFKLQTDLAEILTHA